MAEARLIVQRKAGQDITQAVANPFADAGHPLLTGAYAQAVRKPPEAYRAA
ncbi:hypothetical protein QQY24_09210 [Streptomyces sp. TG1A-8]|uniref:hypothetical protein n=1 Tax=Streptomyces sp. TG1A-8 TaxID=3051385 RepID=UPI00265BCB55|nr:hypothetical protein [Streptomyces sp. TG1A-8]MDO0925577.1 hypothetical protein [Streptomyces sp. TG1A-8]